jgi:hypothetical protein
MYRESDWRMALQKNTCKDMAKGPSPREKFGSWAELCKKRRGKEAHCDFGMFQEGLEVEVLGQGDFDFFMDREVIVLPYNSPNMYFVANEQQFNSRRVKQQESAGQTSGRCAKMQRHSKIVD